MAPPRLRSTAPWVHPGCPGRASGRPESEAPCSGLVASGGVTIRPGAGREIIWLRPRHRSETGARRSHRGRGDDRRLAPRRPAFIRPRAVRSRRGHTRLARTGGRSRSSAAARCRRLRLWRRAGQSQLEGVGPASVVWRFAASSAIASMATRSCGDWSPGRSRCRQRGLSGLGWARRQMRSCARSRFVGIRRHGYDA
jgi:hypothetical protein